MLMQRLSRADWEQANKAVLAIYAQETLAGLRQTVLAQLSTMVPCDYSSYNEFDFQARKAVVHLGTEAPEIRNRIHVFEAFIASDPHVLYTARTKDYSARQVIDLVSHRKFREHPIYREFYRELGVKHRSAFFLRKHGKLDLAVALLRQGRAFSHRELALMEALRPHLEQAYYNVTRSERVQRQKSFQDLVLESTRYASVLLDNEARCLWVSPRAEAWLHKYFSGMGKDFVLPGRVRDWVLHERQRLQEPSFQPPAGPLEILTTDSRLVIQATHRTDGLILLILEEEQFGASPEEMRRLGLTRREAQVLYWISQDKSNLEIAVVLGMSRRTVDKHVEHILAKLGVETRAGASRVAELCRRQPEWVALQRP